MLALCLGQGCPIDVSDTDLGLTTGGNAGPQSGGGTRTSSDNDTLTPPVCGNDTCESGETSSSCPADCNSSGGDQPGNLIVNGDFEQGHTGFTTDFPYGGLDSGLRIIVTRDPNEYHSAACSYGDHTTGSGGLMAANADPPDPSKAIWAQTVNVSSGKTYTFSLWVSSWHVPNGDRLRIRINGSPVGNTFEVPSTCGVWQHVTRQWSSGTSKTAAIRIVDESAGGSDFALDDLSLTTD